MVEFRKAIHSITGQPCVEVWEAERMIATIYQDRGKPGAFRVISKHPIETVTESAPPLPDVLRVSIKF